MKALTKLRLLVVERGANMPALSRNEPIGDLVVVPDGDARPAELALRVIERIARAERNGRHIEEATIAVTNGGDAQRAAARALIARALVKHQMHAGGGEIVLWARCAPTSETRHEVLALAGVVMSELDSTSVSLRVLFEQRPGAFASIDDEPASGVHQKFEASEPPSHAAMS